MRLTEFRGLMTAHFGPPGRRRSRGPRLLALGGRTADEALDAGEETKAVWFAVCDDFDVPAALRHGLPD